MSDRELAQEWLKAHELDIADAVQRFVDHDCLASLAALLTQVRADERERCMKGRPCQATHGHGYGEPQDCDWPYCGCDKEADRVMEGLQECGWLSPDGVKEEVAEAIESLLARCVELQAKLELARKALDFVTERAGRGEGMVMLGLTDTECLGIWLHGDRYDKCMGAGDTAEEAIHDAIAKLAALLASNPEGA